MAWSEPISGDPMNIFCKKMKKVKKALVDLNKIHGNVYSSVMTARESLHNFQLQLSNNPDNVPLLKDEEIAIKHLEKCILEEEAMLLQKSRMNCLCHGDGNSRFFFNQIKSNWNRNKILALTNDSGELHYGFQNVSKIAVDYFRETLGTPYASAVSK